jgi:serine/threonine-protein kinase
MTALLLNNRYQILQSLGRGGFGETFLAVDTHMPSARKCVIKQLQPTVEAAQIPPWLQERFQREAAILEELGENQPQIPQLYAYFSEGGNFFLVQEWIEGITLSQKHQQQGNLSEAEVRQILLELLSVLDYVHSRNIVHRDIKPDNIILRASDGKPVLIDFGIVKEAIATAVNFSAKTPYSAILGTPGYMASEQAAGRPVYSSDLYSLGLTAIFLLTGKTPQYLASDPHTGEILWRQDAPHLHSNLAAVLERAVRFHPRDRFTSAKEMLAALRASAQSVTGATVAVAPGEILQRQRPKATPTQNLTAAAPPTLNGEESEMSNPWRNWLLLALLFIGTIVGGLAFGYMLINRGGLIPRPAPSPEQTFDANPQPFPTPEQQEPAVREPERPPEQPQPEATVSPQPENSPAPAPSPEATAIPAPEATVTPAPEVTVTPAPEVTAAPEPETSPTSQPQATPSSPPVEPSPPPATTRITPEPPPAPPQPKANPEN